jgi:hypothetical protein
MSDMLLVLSVTVGIVLAMVPLLNAFFASVDEAHFQHTSELCRRMVDSKRELGIMTDPRRREARPQW